MLDHKYQKPRFRTIVIAAIVFAILLATFWSLASVVKFVGAPFLYLPAKLGLIQQVTVDEVHTINIVVPGTMLHITQPGHYAVFTDDYQLLQISNGGFEAHARPWITIKSHTTGQQIPVTWVERGLEPYDTPVVAGRPIFDFDVMQPGEYALTYPKGEGVIAVVPDYTTGKETMIVLAYGSQLTLLVILLSLLFYWRSRHGRSFRQRKAVGRQQRLAQSNAFWQAEMRRMKETGQNK